ncbi:MAG: UvrD-helicase domain-containing protein [Oscillospiraceae bacterium]|nr:UvrD-helicase domain-containing protein [Oscillospiraceae bacterium]
MDVNQQNQLKQNVFKRLYSRLNDMQRAAVLKTTGPVLILAGAGSGKTTVLIHRVANLIRFGRASEAEGLPNVWDDADFAFLQDYADGRVEDDGRLESLLAVQPVRPWNILAITFTNKAAGELKERLSLALGDRGGDVNASTFHSCCARILRAEIEHLGYTGNFTIYDTDDSLRVIKECMKTLNIDDKHFAPRAILSAISAAKDTMEDVTMFPAGGDYFEQVAAKVYALYHKTLKDANALDFDDMILLTVQLFEQFPEVLEKYRNRFRYIMVDEYQDTNHKQFRLVELLAGGSKNICVVGDDDQSIYKFRGATIENILSFEQQYPGASVIRLEENYRSTGTILDAANEVIANNTQRKGKTLWTSNEQGDKITVYRGVNEQAESAFIAKTINENVKNGARYSDHAVLYRMNAQSASLEQALIRFDVPYRILGGLRFFERKEIKDMLAYLCVLANPGDRLRLMRIINEPKRGIGNATLDAADQIADQLGISLFEVISHAEDYPLLSKKAGPLAKFAEMMQSIMDGLEERSISETFQLLLEESGYLQALKAQGFEGQTRVENIEELGSTIAKYEEETEEPTLAGFLEEVALYTDLDNYDPDADAVVLMTLHSAKGLEFPVVFIPGMEEGIFPGMQSIYNPAECEEERRLAYVGITRARKRLYLCCAGERMLFGRTNRNRQSRFLEEIPSTLVERRDELAQRMQQQRAAAASAPATHRPAVNRGSSIGSRAAAHPAAAPAAFDISAGDTVSHRVFGKGLVISITPMGGDHLVEIAFDKVGTKRIMSNFAKLTKV